MVVEVPELPLELPEPMLPEPVPPLLEPELGAGVGVAGVVVVELLPEVPPLAAPEPDLLKWASHSEREIWPSLLLSTAEKSGVELLEPELVLLPDADGVEDGEDEDLSLLVLDDELCARATLDSANRAAAVAALRIFSFIE